MRLIWLTWLQVFYREFGELMMRQPVIGFEFTTYAPLVLVPYVILLALNVFNRIAAFFLRSPTLLFEDDWETASPYATSGTRLLNIELENYANGQPLGLTISPQGEPPVLPPWPVCCTIPRTLRTIGRNCCTACWWRSCSTGASRSTAQNEGCLTW